VGVRPVCVFVFSFRRRLSIDRRRQSSRLTAATGVCSTTEISISYTTVRCHCCTNVSVDFHQSLLKHSSIHRWTVRYGRRLRINTIFQAVSDLDLCDVGGVPDIVESCRIPCHTWSQLEMEQAGNFKSNRRQLAYNQIK